MVGKNRNIYEYLEEYGSEQPQISIVTCFVGRRDQCLPSNQPPGKTTSEVLPTTDNPSDQGNTGSKTLSHLSPKLFNKEAQHISLHSPEYQP
jgi:hypothetical protein